MSTQALLIDDALELLSPSKPYKGPTFSNTGGREGEEITHIASFTFPKGWDGSRRSAVAGIIDGAVRRLAEQDRLYSEELGAADFEQDWKHDRHCHYMARPGAIAPSLDDVKNFIDTTLRQEFANPSHWVRKKTRKGTRYFIVGSGSETEPDYESIVRMAVYYLGTRPPLNTHEHMMVMNETPDGRFLSVFENPGTVMVLRGPTNPEDGMKFEPLEPQPTKHLRQGIEISEQMARAIMPALGVDIHRIKDEPRARGHG